MHKPYLIPTEDCTSEIIINKSRFISTLRHICSLSEMRQFYNELRVQHPKASHNCWAVIAGGPEDSSLYGFSDDGEPGGTAGKPMFKVLQYSGKGQVGIIVTRYFGGIKLGTGGLVRAYTQATKSILEVSGFIQFSKKRELVCIFPYEDEGVFRYLVEQHGVTDVNFTYAEGVSATLLVDEAGSKTLVDQLRQKLGHSLTVTDTET